jgi:small GTP-binding protein
MISLKIITLGEPSVGKTALTHHFVYNKFSHTDMTIGVDFAIKHINNDKMQIWDTAGQESFRSISRSYYRGADAALLVFNLHDITSLNKIMYWYNDFRQVNNNALCVLVGTKCDLKHNVCDKKIKEITSSLEIEYFETSSKMSINTKIPFMYIYNHFKTIYSNKTESTNISLHMSQTKQGSCCI